MANTIEDFIQKIKSFYSSYREELCISAIIVFVGLSSYALGLLEGKGSHPAISIRNADEGAQKTFTKAYAAATSSEEVKKQSVSNTSGPIVASKNGTAYYFSTCSGSSRILDKNKIYFKTEDEAQKAGYHIASGCKK